MTITKLVDSANGLATGVTVSRIYDATGPVGTADQSVLLTPR